MIQELTEGMAARKAAAIQRGHWTLEDALATLTELKEKHGGQTRFTGECTLHVDADKKTPWGNNLRYRWTYKLRDAKKLQAEIVERQLSPPIVSEPDFKKGE